MSQENMETEEIISPTLSTIQLFQTIEQKDVTRVTELLECEDCDPSYQDPSTGSSPLMVAACVGSVEIVRMLLNEGAPWNAVDKEYRCAGDYAIMKNHQECSDAILRHGTISEMLLGTLVVKDKRTLSSNYLKSNVEYTGDKLMDSDGLAVMMDWEKDLMQKHAAFICHADQQMLHENNEPVTKSKKKSIRVLNIGFGMGIVDTAIQSHCPTEHYIIEAHPQVYEKLQSNGWTEKPGVKVLFGRWQDVLPNLDSGITFDGIFYDPYAEDDLDLKDFNSMLPHLLTPITGRYSFYNGLCPDNAFFHAVACEVLKLDLNSMNIECEYESIKIDVSDSKIWDGVTKRYWYFDTYYLPKCFFKSDN